MPRQERLRWRPENTFLGTCDAPVGVKVSTSVGSCLDCRGHTHLLTGDMPFSPGKDRGLKCEVHEEVEKPAGFS